MPLAPPNDIIAALRDYRLTVHEMDGWRNRGRPYAFNPYGQAWHHDAFSESFPDWDAARYMTFSGRPDLPPPLCNGAIGEQGTIYLCAYGNANHAGKNRSSVHARLQKGQAPLDRAYRLPYEADSVVGNSRLWGWECRNAGTGRDPWEQLETMIRAGAAMADACGWNANQNAAHAELTARKIDPAGFEMANFRLSIALTQLHHAGYTTVPPKEDETMEHAIIALYAIARGTTTSPYDVRLREPAGFIHWQKVGDAAGGSWRTKLNETLVPQLRKENPRVSIPNL